MRDWTNLVHHVKYQVYRRAAGIEDESRADEQFVERLRVLKQDWNPHGKLLLLAFDEAYDEGGRPLPLVTDFYTPNAWAEKVASRYPEHFVWAASIHPYRRDSVAELERSAAAGAKAVKWLPNAQLMDAASPLCDDFYRQLAALRLPLLTHVGEEQAVDATEAQRFGNPLRFRRALDAGVRVIIWPTSRASASIRTSTRRRRPPPRPRALPQGCQRGPGRPRSSSSSAFSPIRRTRSASTRTSRASTLTRS
jgi:hypothetical protein